MPQTISLMTGNDTRQVKQRLAAVDQLLLELGELPLDASLNDCGRIQTILNSGSIKPSDTYKLQSLGLALGNVIAGKLGLDWVIVEDEHGRDPALRYCKTSLILYPLTMISKRIEKGEAVNVPELLAISASHVKQLSDEVD